MGCECDRREDGVPWLNWAWLSTPHLSILALFSFQIILDLLIQLANRNTGFQDYIFSPIECHSIVRSTRKISHKHEVGQSKNEKLGPNWGFTCPHR